jgi:hypothetical protein
MALVQLRIAKCVPTPHGGRLVGRPALSCCSMIQRHDPRLSWWKNTDDCYENYPIRALKTAGLAKHAVRFESA